MKSPSKSEAPFNNLVADGDFTDEDSSAWTFSTGVAQSLAAREIENGNPYFAASISGSATQVVPGITPSALYVLTVNTRGSERQSDGQDRNPTGYIEIKGGTVDVRVYLRDVHDWKEQKVSFRSSPATDSLQLTLFGITGKMEFDDVSLREELEIIDPDELIKNPSFNQGEEHWFLRSPNANAEALIVREGDDPCFMASHLGAAVQSLAIGLNKTYVFKFRAKATGATVGAGGGVVSLRNAGQGLTSQDITVTNDWVDYELDHSVPNVGGNVYLTLTASGGPLNQDVVTLFDNFSLKHKK